MQLNTLKDLSHIELWCRMMVLQGDSPLENLCFFNNMAFPIPGSLHMILTHAALAREAEKYLQGGRKGI
jgi:hypothetical protein